MEVNVMMIDIAYKFHTYLNQVTGKSLTYGICSARLPTKKKEFVWLKRNG